MKTVLVYSPFMGYTGSEMAIRNLIMHSKRIRYIILSGLKGELLYTFPRSVPTYYIEGNVWDVRIDKLYKKLGMKGMAERKFQKIVEKYKPDLILVNTIAAHRIVEALGHSTVPFVVYVHEMPPTYDMLPRGSLLFLVKNARGFIACSEAAAEPIRRMGIKKVFIFRGTIDCTFIRISEDTLYNLRNQYGSYDSIFVMSGTPVYRKGLHLIPEIASFLRSKNAALIWVGGAPWPTSLIDYVERVKEQEGLDNLFLVGQQTGTTYYTYLNLASAFLLTSIEDPYPLVMLEAAYLRKPIIAFRSGGVAEFVREGMGRVVPLVDLEAFLQAITDFLEGRMKIDPDLLHEEAKKHDTALRVHEFEDILLSFM